MSLRKTWSAAGMLALFFGLVAFSKSGETGFEFVVPPGWPKPHADFSKNPLTREKFLLGNRLFFDPLLSKDSTISCSSCHLSFTAFTHVDHRVSHGIYGRQGTRNSLALINLAWSRHFMWDGRADNLEQQPLHPIENPAEMDNSMAAIVEKLNRSAAWRGWFYEAFHDSSATSGRVLQALEVFTVMLVSSNSKYDSVMRHEPNVFFTAQEENGYRLFRKNCATCHTEPLFTNNGFENNGLPIDTALMDLGRMKITGKRSDRLKFKVPTLRNVAFSAPYFHDGRFNKLREVIEHYASGIVESPTLARPLRQKISLEKNEKTDLLAFLRTLTDKAFLYDRAFRFDYPDTFE